MRRVSVLLVDEDLLVLKATARPLRSYFDMRIAESVSNAVTELQRELPAVVVADLHLRGTLRLMQRVAEDHPEIRRLMVSWWPNSDGRFVPSGLVEKLLPRCDAAALFQAITLNTRS